MYVYMYIMYVYLHIYIYIHRERERERCTHMCLTRRSLFGPDGMPCVVLWRPEALDCRAPIPPETWSKTPALKQNVRESRG